MLEKMRSFLASKIALGRETDARPNLKEAGQSGTETYGGVFVNDYLDELEAEQGAEVWWKMQKTDGQIAMLVSMVENPLLSAEWMINAVDDSDEEVEIAEKIRSIVFDHMGPAREHLPFRSFLQEAVTYPAAGCAPFEIVHKVFVGHPTLGNAIGIKRIGWRDPKSISRWNLDEDETLESIEQQLNNDLGSEFIRQIPGDTLLIYSFKRLGANYQGESILRPCYGNYLRKKLYDKLAVIGVEKTALGFPYVQVPPGTENSARATALFNLIKNIVTHQKIGGVITSNETLENFKVDFDAEKLKMLIEHEDVRMAKRFLANFLELGMSGKGGAYALGQDLSDVFLSAIRFIASTICEGFNSKVLRPLVDMNFGRRDKYPELGFSGIDENASKEFAEVIVKLKQAGLIQVSDRLGKFLHKQFRLPEFDEEEGLGDPDPEPGPPPFGEEDPEKDPEGVEGDEPKGKDAKDKKKKKVGGRGSEEDEAGDEDDAEKIAAAARRAAETLAAEGGKTGRLIRRASSDLGSFLVEDLTRRSGEMVDRIGDWMRKGRSRSDIIENRTSLPGKSVFRGELIRRLAGAAVRASGLAADELGDRIHAFAEGGDDLKRFMENAPPAARARLNSQVDLIVESVDADLKKAVVFSFNNNVDSVDSVDRVVRKMREAADRHIAGPSLSAVAGNAVGVVVNQTRNDIFLTEDAQRVIESFVVTNPSPEAAICKSLAGRVITKEEYRTGDLPPWHHNCETYIVPQRAGRKGNRPADPRGLTPDPEETGIPLDRILKSKTL